jgi:hypothetical protein
MMAARLVLFLAAFLVTSGGGLLMRQGVTRKSGSRFLSGLLILTLTVIAAYAIYPRDMSIAQGIMSGVGAGVLLHLIGVTTQMSRMRNGSHWRQAR